MKLMLWAIIGVLIGLQAVWAQDFGSGDRIRLIERDNHIPAHPAPGDSGVHLRFTSGSPATVLSVDAQTGWLRIESVPLSGSQTTGWIVKRYIKGLLGDTVTPDSPDWCPPKGSPQPHQSGRLRIATWNLGNLHAGNGQSVFTGNDPSVKRTTDDYNRIRCYVRLFDPDILAVQEVDGEEALSRVVDAEVYHVHVSSRPKPNFLNGKQNTGFAYKRNLTMVEQADFEALNTSGGLRRGTRLDVTHNGQTLKLMSVHLKSGCFHNGSTSTACSKLAQQIPILENWIDQAAQGTQPFIVLGDFNRRFNVEDDNVWTELDDGQPANADLSTTTKDMPISCRDNEFTTFIDHIVVDKRVSPWVDRTSFRHMTYRQADKAEWDQISDHCPVIVDLWIE